LTIYEYANILMDKYDLINLVIKDLFNYERTANELWIKGVITEMNIELSEILDLPFTHRN
jgi:hypothetical protein